MRKWLRRLGIAVVLMAVASATALYSYGRFAEAARGPASHALPTAADATALDRAVAPLLRALLLMKRKFLFSNTSQTFVTTAF